VEGSWAAGIILPGCAPRDQLPERIIIALHSQCAFANLRANPAKIDARKSGNPALVKHFFILSQTHVPVVSARSIRSTKSAVLG
jgi:hypothetical protein